jgi:diaminopimelate decarboxylase
MADNPRPALYHADYTACIIERPDETLLQTVRVVGKFCESGDELIAAARLPFPERGEHLVMPAAGAYQISMSSNYNMAARPAVLWLDGGRVEVLQKRVEAYEDPWWLG